MYHYAMEGNLMKRQRIQYLWGMLALMLLVYILLHDLLGGTLFAHEPLDS